MPNAFIFSASNNAARAHFVDTVETGIQISRILPFVGSESLSRLRGAYGTGLGYCWGGKSGGQDELYVKLMQAGDLILGYREKTIICAAYFVELVRSRELGLSLWPDATDRPFDLVYFFTKPIMLNRHTSDLDYFAKVYQGLRRLPSSDRMLKDFGTFANFVRQGLGGIEALPEGPLEVDDEEALEPLSPEGRRRLRIHWQIERDKRNVDRVKKQWTKEDKWLRCECCSFSYVETYGEIGRGFVEAHHRIPLKDVNGNEFRPEITDFAPVCANCHRMLHRAGVSIDQLQLLLTGSAGAAGMANEI